MMMHKMYRNISKFEVFLKQDNWDWKYDVCKKKKSVRGSSWKLMKLKNNVDDENERFETEEIMTWLE